MSRITSLLASVALFCLGISVPGASANPIAVSGGTIWATGLADTGPAAFTGFPGFSFVGGVTPLEGRIDPFVDCNPCLPNSSISVGGNLSGAALPGIVWYNGAVYDVGSMTSQAALAMEFAGTVIAPSLTGFPTMVTVPFTATGSLFIADTTHLISGMGFASLLFRSQSIDENARAWFVDQVRYDFSPSPAPVPEPGTVTTLAFGLAALARSAYKRRNRRA